MESGQKQNDSLLSVKDLVVEYTSDGKTVHAVNGVSFDLKKGHTLGLVGETGAGKTTIAKAILRILPDMPAKIKSGEVLFEGHDILKMQADELRGIRGHKISMIFQDPMTALNPVKRIGHQVAEVITLHNSISKHEAERRAQEMLEMVGITKDRYKEYPHQFSGGMKQRVIIAMALACSPALLLADEPTTALDVTIQAQVLEMINRLKVEKSASMLLITHDLGVVAETCDEVAVVYAGEIVEYGTLEQVFDHPAHPYTRGLFDALPDMMDEGEWLKPIEGLPPDPSKLPKGCKFGPRCPYATRDCAELGDVPVADQGGNHLCRCRHIERIVEE